MRRDGFHDSEGWRRACSPKLAASKCLVAQGSIVGTESVHEECESTLGEESRNSRSFDLITFG